MQLPNVIALDAGGATLKASVVRAHAGASAAAAPFVLANQSATLSSSSSSSTSAFIGQELLDKERHGSSKLLRYVRPVERCVALLLAMLQVAICVMNAHVCWFTIAVYGAEATA